LGAQALQGDGEIPTPEVGRDLAAGVDYRAHHQLEDAEVLRLAVGAHRAGGPRTLDELGRERMQDGAGLLDPLRGARGAEQQLLQPAILRLPLEHLLEEGRERVPGVWILAGGLEQAHDLAELVVEQLFDQQSLVREVTVDGADADVGVVGDVVQRHAQAAVGEELARGGQDALAIAHGVLSEQRLGDAFHGHSLSEWMLTIQMD
jgi:hypothetical protein